MGRERAGSRPCTPPPCPVLGVCPPHGWSREEEGPELSGRVRTPWLCPAPPRHGRGRAQGLHCAGPPGRCPSWSQPGLVPEGCSQAQGGRSKSSSGPSFPVVPQTGLAREVDGGAGAPSSCLVGLCWPHAEPLGGRAVRVQWSRAQPLSLTASAPALGLQTPRAEARVCPFGELGAPRVATALCAAPRLPWGRQHPVLCWAELLAPRGWGRAGSQGSVGHACPCGLPAALPPPWVSLACLRRQNCKWMGSFCSQSQHPSQGDPSISASHRVPARQGWGFWTRASAPRGHPALSPAPRTWPSARPSATLGRGAGGALGRGPAGTAPAVTRLCGAQEVHAEG